MAVGDDLLGAVTLVDSLLANGAGFLVPGEIETGTLTHVVTADDLPAYREALAGCPADVHFVVLLPPLAVVIEREQSHPTEWRRGGRLEPLHLRLSQWSDVALLDPGDLAPDLVADRVMALAATGDALLSSIAFPSATD